MATVYNVLDTRDKQELTEKIDADKNELSKTIQNTKTELQSNIDALESQHNEDKTELQTQIYSLESIKADKTEITAHNTSNTAHNDIRLLIQNLITKLNTIADSDDSTLDQMSEIVEYIKNNKELIDSITTTKVSVSDIINNLVTNVANKPLSAAMGVELKALIDAIPDTTLATVNEKILEHNVSADAHEDMRNDIVSVQSDATAAQTTADAAQALANNAQDDADEALQRLNSLEVGSGKIDRIVETTNGIAVCEDPLIDAPLVGATVYGNTRQNLWVDDGATLQFAGVTVTRNGDGSVTASGESTATSNQGSVYAVDVYSLRPGYSYVLSVDKYSGKCVPHLQFYTADGKPALGSMQTIAAGSVSKSFTVDGDWTYCRMGFLARETGVASGTYRVMLNEGDAAEPWCPPGLNGVEELSIVTAGKNLLPADESEWNTSNNTSTSIDGDIVTVSSTSGTYTRVEVHMEFLAGMTVHFGRKSASGGYAIMQLTYSVDGKTYFITTDDSPHTVPSYATNIFIQLYCNNSANDGAYTTVFTMPYLRIDGMAEYAPLSGFTTTPIDLDGHALNSLPDGTRDELRVDATGAVTLVQRVGVATAPTAASGWAWVSSTSRGRFTFPATSRNTGTWDQSKELLCDKLPPATSVNDVSHAVTVNNAGYAKNPAITSTATAATVAGGATYLYPLATPQVIYLGTIDSPTLPAQTSHVWFSSNIPVNDFSVRYWLPNGELVEELYRTGATEEISDNEIISIWNGATGDIIEATNADIEAIFE